jgi:hypothetical protein
MVWAPKRRGPAEPALAVLEHARVLEEEVTLFRKEEVKAGEVYLLVIDLDLGEVRVHGHIEHEPREHLVLRIDSDIPRDLRVGVISLDKLPGDAE